MTFSVACLTQSSVLLRSHRSIIVVSGGCAEHCREPDFDPPENVEKIKDQDKYWDGQERCSYIVHAGAKAVKSVISYLPGAFVLVAVARSGVAARAVSFTVCTQSTTIGEEKSKLSRMILVTWVRWRCFGSGSDVGA